MNIEQTTIKNEDGTSEVKHESENYTDISALLNCGTTIRIVQKELGMNYEVYAIPSEGGSISNTSEIVNGKLKIYMSAESLIGLAQFLHFVSFGPSPKKKLFGLF